MSADAHRAAQRGRLNAKVAIVTGAASGLGQAIALTFAAEGASVICADIDGHGVAETVHTVTRAGGSGVAADVDVTDVDSADALVAFACREVGPVEILVHCAGIAGNGTATSTDVATWERVIAVNLTGTWLMARAVLPGMIESRRGSIVNIASIAGIVGVPGTVAYAAAKAGVAGLTRAMATDHAAEGVRVNALAPGTVPTPLVLAAYAARGEVDSDEIASGLEAVARGRYPAQRLGSPQEIANTALFLASDEALWITGVVLPIDGGLTASAWLADG
jgi:NAD(P)-dependent dehydrogenase (short-subunit alcohol dehydrogenase family)